MNSAAMSPTRSAICATLRDERSNRSAGEKAGAATVQVNNAARDDRHEWQDVKPDYWDERMAPICVTSSSR